MFNINYKIIEKESDDIRGGEGFFQIACNNNIYGEFYPKEIEKYMDTVDISFWMNCFLQVACELEAREYILLSDTESYNTWIEFKLQVDVVVISILRADKPNGTQAIEYQQMPNSMYSDWDNEKVLYSEFKKEIIEKSSEYLKDLVKRNEDGMANNVIEEIKCKIDKLVF